MARNITIRILRIFLYLAAIFFCFSKGYALELSPAPENSVQQKSVPFITLPSSQYQSQIQPIFDKRCVVCHSCYTAPCQLNLTAFEGMDRGATKALVYNGQRLKAVHPTRLFEDAKSTEEWQHQLGFFPVQQQMSQLLALKMSHPKVTVPFHTEDDLFCAKDTAELDNYFQKKPEGGMPFGFPALSSSEYETLTSWIDEGAQGPGTDYLAKIQHPSNGEKGERTLLKWEEFFNQPDAKVRISARYIYEHLFLAHIRFEENPGDYYRLVRSRTPAPQAIDEIATALPYDDPGVKQVYYRFRRITQTIVRKSHINYLLNEAKMNRFRELFIDTTWENKEPQFPSYNLNVASNPFLTFKDIPARSRYQFLLDDAFYHVMSFIRGPVCKGNVALNVIEPHFYVMFIKPESDLTVTHTDFLPQVAPLLALPARGEDLASTLYVRYKADQLEYEKKRRSLYQQFGKQGRMLSDIWDGDGTNDNAIQTVYRHLDSADVIKGAWGGIPKTTLVLDYPIFERIYYDLVAGFDVYGNVVHQLSTRMYMDNLRIEAEDNFLGFLPKDQRSKLRSYWYRGTLSESMMYLLNPLYEDTIETGIQYLDKVHAKDEFLGRVLNERLSPLVRGPIDTINLHESHSEVAQVSQTLHAEQDIVQEFSKITKLRGAFTQPFPDVSLIRIHKQNGEGAVYTMIHNKEYLNVSFIFLDELYREPEADDLHIIHGFQGSYPNFFFDVPYEKLDEFVSKIKVLKVNDNSFGELIGEFGIRRLDPRFWEISDWFADQYKSLDLIESGILDLSRYENF